MAEKRATVAKAIAAWEAKGPTSLTVALMAEALYGVREVCQWVEANPVGWGGAPAVSLVRTLAAVAPVPADTEERCDWCSGTGYVGPDMCNQCDGSGSSPEEGSHE